MLFYGKEGGVLIFDDLSFLFLAGGGVFFSCMTDGWGIGSFGHIFSSSFLFLVSPRSLGRRSGRIFFFFFSFLHFPKEEVESGVMWGELRFDNNGPSLIRYEISPTRALTARSLGGSMRQLKYSLR